MIYYEAKMPTFLLTFESRSDCFMYACCKISIWFKLFEIKRIIIYLFNSPRKSSKYYDYKYLIVVFMLEYRMKHIPKDHKYFAQKILVTKSLICISDSTKLHSIFVFY